MHQRVTIGVYVECINPTVTTTKTESGCTNEQCAHYRKPLAGLYCYHCGKPIGDYTVSVQGHAINAREVSGIFAGEELMPAMLEWWENKPNNIDIWQPNLGGDVEIELGDDQAREITQEDKAGQLANFYEKYGAPLAQLEAAYGPNNVKVKWGVVAETR